MQINEHRIFSSICNNIITEHCLQTAYIHYKCNYVLKTKQKYFKFIIIYIR